MLSAPAGALEAIISGGVLVLLPTLVLVRAAEEMGALLVPLATPIAVLAPPGVFDDLVSPSLVALVVLVGPSFVLGVPGRVALLGTCDGERSPVFAIEEIAGGRLAVLAPIAPMGLSGTIRVVPAGRVHLLDVSLGEATRVIGQWGVDLGDLLASGEGGRR
jgi:hypothetical protein